MRIIVIRHAFATHNGSPLSELHGHSDAQLTNEGHRQAIALRSKLARYAPIDAVFCSDAVRCKQTAQLAFPHHTAIETSLLRERDFGLLEGVDTGRTIRLDGSTYTPEDLAYILTDFDTPAPGGESWRDTRARTDKFLTQLGSLSYGTVAVIAHKGSMRSILESLTGKPWKGSINHCEPIVAA